MTARPMKPLARDDPEYVDQLEATVALMFIPLVMVEVLGPDPTAMTIVGDAVDAVSDVVLAIMERTTGLPTSPHVQAWLRQRNAQRN